MRNNTFKVGQCWHTDGDVLAQVITPGGQVRRYELQIRFAQMSEAELDKLCGDIQERGYINPQHWVLDDPDDSMTIDQQDLLDEIAQEATGL